MYRIERVEDSGPPKKRKLDESRVVSQEIRAITSSIEAFADDFSKVVAGDKKGNYVSSSLSVHVALAMTAFGAEGSTRRQMFKGLHLPIHYEVAKKGFDGFFQTLNNIPGIILQLANKIYTSRDCKVKDNYKELLSRIFHSESDCLDFSDTANVIRTVNGWCNKKTKGKIQEIVTSSDFGRDTVFILLNAVYFNGNWESRFSIFETSMQPFHINTTTTVQVPTMHKRKHLYYKDLENHDAECIAIPYKNEDLSMIIILPKKIDGLGDIEKNWEKMNSECLGSLFERYEDVNLLLPRFKVETKIHLEKYLRQLEINEMFTNKANFKGISDTFVKITSAVQKVFIEVNEEGTEAAAMTVQSGGGPPPKVIDFNVNRPFLFQIYDRNLEISLFTGRIENPKSH